MDTKPNDTTTPPTMHHISPTLLATSLPDRISYLRQFLSFTSSDVAALHAAAPIIAPLVPVVVDAVYTKLLSFDITAASFIPRQTGYVGAAPTSLDALGHDHPMIKFRKDFLAGYLKKIVTMDYDQISTWEYLDKVGKIHTGSNTGTFKHRARKPPLRVELMHCAVLLGFVGDVVVDAVMGHDGVDADTKVKVVRALNKVLWIQNDLFARHYVAEAEEAEAERERGAGCVTWKNAVAVVAVAGVVDAVVRTLWRYIV